MIIRDFTIDDHDSVCEVALSSWKVTYSQRYTVDQIEKIIKDWYSKDNHLGMIPRIKDKSLFFKLLLIDQKIVGFCLGDIKESSLNRLYIQPECFNKGYGTLLLEMFEKCLIDNGRNYITLSCDRLNTIGLPYYKKHGFKIMDEDDEDYTLKKCLIVCKENQ
jgi:ribosomal protein S18 acetylase RimI-like enzyme